MNPPIDCAEVFPFGRNNPHAAGAGTVEVSFFAHTDAVWPARRTIVGGIEKQCAVCADTVKAVTVTIKRKSRCLAIEVMGQSRRSGGCRVRHGPSSRAAATS